MGDFQDMDGSRPFTSALIAELQSLKDKFKNEDDDFGESPFRNLEKATVLQECRDFHDPHIVTTNPRRCCHLITKLLYVLSQGEGFTSNEVTDVFFGVTKLFQSTDLNLRRMMYLFIKEISETTHRDEVIIVTASLVQDMNSREELCKANAMRVLAKIVDSNMLGAIERYIKQAIVDSNAFVASSALLAGSQLMHTSPEVVRRWINEVQEAINSSSDMVQYHGLVLLYQIKSHDKLAVSKIVQQLTRGNVRSPLATCLLIRYTTSLLKDDLEGAHSRAAYQFLESCLRHKSEMVIYEAARAICNLPMVESRDLTPAITVLQLFLNSPKPALRFSAMRTLSEISATQPVVVSRCNDDMEALVTDRNRSIATLAVTTLLKTGNESNIDRLMKQISGFMSDITDEFKVVVVRAIRELCLKYPAKHRVLVGFMAAFLREEGGYEFKKAITDAIVEVMEAIPETKESSLLHLCEFIEDCEFTELMSQILHLIGTVGPYTSAPARFIRFIYNRVILENNVVRAAAVNTLGMFAARVPELRASIIPLIKRSLQDDDDEVRDRAAVMLDVLGKDEDHIRHLSEGGMPMQFRALERSVKTFMQRPTGSDGRPQALDFANLPIVEDHVEEPVDKRKKRPTKAGADKTPTSATSAAVEPVEDPAAVLYRMPELASLGRVFRTTPKAMLTEHEVEYVVDYVKHIFDNHVVLQFNVNNTIDDQLLTNVRVNLVSGDDEQYTVQAVIPAAQVKFGAPAPTFVVLERHTQPASCSFACELAFRVVQVDPHTGEPEGDPEGYEEDYRLEELEISPADFMAKVPQSDFRRAWDQIGNENEKLEKFALQFRKLEDAVHAVIDFLGMQPCDGTGTVAHIAGKNSHTLHLSGVFLGNVPVLVRAQLQLDESEGVVLKLVVRSDDIDVSELVTECIQ